MMVKLLAFSIFILFTTVSMAQKISHDTLLQISPKVFIYTSKETTSEPSYVLAINYDAEFHYNYIYIKTKKNINYCRVRYSGRIKTYIADAYQEELQQGVSIEKADSSILYRLTRHAVNYHRNHVFHSLGGYEKIETFDKLQGKYHYMDFYAAYRKKVPLYPLYRKNAWRRKKQDSIEVYDCSIERYLLVDSVIYLFTSSIIKPTRSRKRGLRIVEREFKQFVRCIWVKEDEEVLEK